MTDSSNSSKGDSARDVRAPLHVIRLRGPWECRTLGSPIDGRSETVTIPGDWTSVLGTTFQGVARFARRFGRPTGLETGERVVLVVESVEPRGSIWIQGEKLDEINEPGERWQCDVTTRLLPTNQLWIDVFSAEGGEPGRVGEVRLEIFGPNASDQ